MDQRTTIRKRSSKVIGRLPLLDIAIGPDPESGQIRGYARGIIAIGDIVTGGLAIGGLTQGIVAIGGSAWGGLTIGGGSKLNKSVSNSTGLFRGLISSTDDDSIQAQATRLGDTRFRTGQRQAMAIQIGRLGGNR